MYFVSELRLSVVALMIIVAGAMFDISKNRFADVDTGVCQIINLNKLLIFSKLAKESIL